MTIDIVPIREDLIDSFHAALDVVCRERVYLAFLEAPPIEATRASSCATTSPRAIRSWSRSRAVASSAGAT